MAELTQEQVQAIVADTLKTSLPEALKTVVSTEMKTANDAIEALTKQQAELLKNQDVIANTLKTLPPAGAEKKEGEAADKPKLLTAEDVEKMLADRETKHQQTAEQKAVRDTFINDPANGVAKIAKAAKALGFDVAARLGADSKNWPSEAKAVVGGWEQFVKDNKVVIPDVGNATNEGGVTPGEEGTKTGRTGFLQMPADATPAKA